MDHLSERLRKSEGQIAHLDATADEGATVSAFLRAIHPLHAQLRKCSSVDEKLDVLNAHPKVARVVKGPKRKWFEGLSPEQELVAKQLIALGQHERLMSSEEAFRSVLERLVEVDFFYRELGGIVGYHEKVLSLLRGEAKRQSGAVSSYHSPSFIDISEETDFVEQAIGWGIDAMPVMAEIFPLGGAADRLHLVEEGTGLELPAAKLVVGGRTLFERLIRDLFAREYLCFLRHGRQLTTPVAIMTSLEKENHRHILQMGEDHGWFGRPKGSFRLFTQPLVPVVGEDGKWCFSSSTRLMLKPGGHGVLWKRARDAGVFEWLEGLGRKKALIRQINNPAAGIDYGLLAFTGIGWKRQMKFGFASCPRRLLAAEGVNVVIERVENGKRTICLTNVEYCDFAKMGIEDKPLREDEPYSRFSSNTNVLFADLKAVEAAVDECPFPGLLLNLKKCVSVAASGEAVEGSMARLESTMQNIADVFVEEVGESTATQETFVTYNHRHKTISTAKKAYAANKSPQETPENCFFELLFAARELLGRVCGFELPPVRGFDAYLAQGPEFSFLYHPALGPIYSLIGKKLQGGRIGSGSELELEIADVSITGLQLQGSLRISADQVMGHFDKMGVLHFSDRKGRCVLEDVSVRNEGVDWGSSRPFWKGEFLRKESLEIVLRGRSEFVAKGVAFEGSLRFEVKDGMRLIVESKNGELVATEQPIE